MTTQPARSSSRLPWILLGGGCLLVGLCVAVVAVAAAAYFYLGRGTTTANEPAVEYILDTSPRMEMEVEGGTRLSIARGVLAEIIRPAAPEVTSGLRVFGSGAIARSCEDTDLIVPLGRANRSLIAEKASSVQAGLSSDSAMGQALLTSIRDLASTKGPHSLVVVTGGGDTCNPEAGQLIADEAKRAGIDLQTFMIGFAVSEDEAQAIKGMVDELPGGIYFDAPDEDSLRNALEEIQKHIDNPPAAPIATVVALGTPGAAFATQIASGSGGSTALASPVPGYVMQTACDHPYFPLRTGAVWNYTGADMSMTWTVSQVSGDQNNASATMESGFDAGSISFEWDCGAGGISSYQMVALGMAELQGLVNFSVESSSGAFLLPASQLSPGATWNSAYSLLMSLSADDTSFSTAMDVTQDYVVSGTESITTPAGTFEALRVDSTGSTTIGGLGLPGLAVPVSATLWYAPGVGLVRILSQAEGTDYVTELESYEIP